MRKRRYSLMLLIFEFAPPALVNEFIAGSYYCMRVVLMAAIELLLDRADELACFMRLIFISAFSVF